MVSCAKEAHTAGVDVDEVRTKITKVLGDVFFEPESAAVVADLITQPDMREIEKADAAKLIRRRLASGMDPNF